MPKYDEYRTNGSAAYDLHSVRDNTARPLRQPERLPDAPERAKPVRRVKTRLAIAPFTVLGTAVAVVMLFLVIFSYVRLYEAQSAVSDLKETKTLLTEEQQRLRSQYENSLDLEAIEARALELGMRQPLPSQIVYVEIAAGDSVELGEVQEERNLFEQIYDAFYGVISDVLEYFSYFATYSEQAAWAVNPNCRPCF